MEQTSYISEITTKGICRVSGTIAAVLNSLFMNTSQSSWVEDSAETRNRIYKATELRKYYLDLATSIWKGKHMEQVIQERKTQAVISVCNAWLPEQSNSF